MDNAAAVKLELQKRSALEFASSTVPHMRDKKSPILAPTTPAIAGAGSANKVSRKKRNGMLDVPDEYYTACRENPVFVGYPDADGLAFLDRY